MSVPFVNIHTHTATGEGAELVNIDKFEAASKVTFASAGLHPWNIGKCDHPQTLAAIEDLCRNGSVAAVGEIGLDRSIETDIETQKSLLVSQLEIARKFQMPTIIHCVRAHSDFLQIMRQNSRVPMIFHGFNGNATTAEQLLAHGAMLSFGCKLLSENKLQNVFAAMPNDCIFLETDTKNLHIGDIYTFAAELKHISLEELKQIIFNNLTRVFGNRWETTG